MRLEDKMDTNEPIQELAVFVHGILFAFHSLGIYYNHRRKNKVDTAIHTGAAIYDLYSTIKHMRYQKGFLERYRENEGR